jgi:XTP/dITP diphosphohydrolase
LTRFVLATANADKAGEIAAILTGVELLPRPASVPPVAETGTTLEANAVQKAKALVHATGEAAVADDTGLEVDALGGAPGVWSARYAGESASYDDNVAKLLRELDGVERRRARFRTAAVACFPDGRCVVAEGAVSGRIAEERRGDGGFGYDPVFIPDEAGGRTFAELSPDEKNALSHRGRAFRALAAQLGIASGAANMTLFYDDGCKFCRSLARRVARLDSKRSLAVLPFSDPDADAQLSSLTPDERARSMHVVLADGTVHSAGRALTDLLAGAPGLRLAARAARRSRVVQGGVDRVYRFIADHRSTFGRFVRDVPPVVHRP